MPGNDDSGGLSSWYVWASLGLFPIAGQSLYLINAPSFAQSRIAFADDDLLIDAPGFVEPVAGGPVQYVQHATFNGERLNRTWLTARELHRGGHLQLQLGPSPSAWGTTTTAIRLTTTRDASTGRCGRNSSSQHHRSAQMINTTGDSMMAAFASRTPGGGAFPRRLVIVVRADPVICGHSGEARNLAEVALQRGFTDVRIVTWPLDLLATSGLPLKPLDGILPYSKGIEVERPEPVGDYKVLDGRYLTGMTGRLVELFTDGVPTVCMSLYLSPHTLAVSEALRSPAPPVCRSRLPPSRKQLAPTSPTWSAPVQPTGASAPGRRYCPPISTAICRSRCRNTPRS